MKTIAPTSRKTEIITAAAQLFREKGYAAATMRDLAGKVGIEAASLYNHIDSKEQILGEICDHIGQMFFEEMNRIEGQDTSVLKKVESLIGVHVEITTKHAAMASVANEDWRHLKEPQLSQFLAMRETYEQKFLQIIKEGIRNEEIRASDATTVLYTILSSVRWLQYWYRPDRELSIQQIKSEIINLILKGIEHNGQISSTKS